MKSSRRWPDTCWRPENSLASTSKPRRPRNNPRRSENGEGKEDEWKGRDRAAEGGSPAGRGMVRAIREGPRRESQADAGHENLQRTQGAHDDRGGDLLSRIPRSIG